MPTLARSIAYAVATLLGLMAYYLLMKRVIPWLQAYRNRQEREMVEALKKLMQRENQQANSDSDALEKKEREHDGG